MPYNTGRRSAASAQNRKNRMVFALLGFLAAAFFISVGGCGSNATEDPNKNPFITPTNLQVLEATLGEYTITWGAVAGATHYELSRAGGPSLVVVNATSTTYIDSSIQSGVTYTYFVKACKNTICSWQTLSSIKLTVPTNIIAYGDSSLSSAAVGLMWDTVSNANQYKIYRNCGLSNESVLTSTIAFKQDTGLVAGTEYKYCITACRNSVCTARSDPPVAATAAAPSQ